jgi:hypothetical protein
MSYRCIKSWTDVKEDVLFVAVDLREWTLWEFHTWFCPPEVEAIITRCVEELKSMF